MSGNNKTYLPETIKGAKGLKYYHLSYVEGILEIFKIFTPFSITFCQNFQIQKIISKFFDPAVQILVLFPNLLSTFLMNDYNQKFQFYL